MMPNKMTMRILEGKQPVWKASGSWKQISDSLKDFTRFKQ